MSSDARGGTCLSTVAGEAPAPMRFPEVFGKRGRVKSVARGELAAAAAATTSAAPSALDAAKRASSSAWGIVNL